MSTVTAEDGRKLEIPEEITFTISIGKHRNNGYITDELMTVTTPDGYITGESIPDKLSKYMPNPSLETNTGDIRKWKIPAGQHIKTSKFREFIEDSDCMELTRYEEDVGRLDQNRLEIKLQTDKVTL